MTVGAQWPMRRRLDRLRPRYSHVDLKPGCVRFVLSIRKPQLSMVLTTRISHLSKNTPGVIGKVVEAGGSNDRLGTAHLSSISSRPAPGSHTAGSGRRKLRPELAWGDSAGPWLACLCRTFQQVTRPGPQLTAYKDDRPKNEAHRLAERNKKPPGIQGRRQHQDHSADSAN